MELSTNDLNESLDCFEQTMRQKLNEKIAATKTFREEFVAKISQFFELCPQCTAIRWEQFTPYFNDGEECVFNVYEPMFCIGEGFYNYWNFRFWDDSIPPVADAELIYGFHNYFHSLDSDVLKFIFGEHAQITITPTEISIEECTDHN